MSLEIKKKLEFISMFKISNSSQQSYKYTLKKKKGKKKNIEG